MDITAVTDLAGNLSGMAVMVGIVYYLFKVFIPKLQTDFFAALTEQQARSDATLQSIQAATNDNYERQSADMRAVAQGLTTLSLRVSQCSGTDNQDHSGEFPREVNHG